MDKYLLNNIESNNLREVIKGMILPSLNFGYGSSNYEFNFDGSAVNVKDLFIRVDCWMETMLELDDTSIKFNQLIFNSGMEDHTTIIGMLEEDGYEIEVLTSGYTYNFENDLNRDVVYCTFRVDGYDTYVLLEVHYGADARAGFGPLVCFKVDDFDYFFNGMSIDAYDSVTDRDYNIYELEDIATYNEVTDSWFHTETGNEIYLYSSANGY